MKYKKILHENVLPDGTFSNKRGAIKTDGGVIIGRGEGCGLPTCNCSPGYYITIITPLKDGKVEGINVTFKNKKEMEKYFK